MNDNGTLKDTDWLTLKEAQARFNVPTQTIKSALRAYILSTGQRGLRGEKRGRDWFVQVRALKAYLRRQGRYAEAPTE